MHAEMAAALITASRAIGQLGKGSENTHGGYKFVSIDKYYDMVGRVALEHGLSWRAREIKHEIVPGLGKSGAVSTAYAFDLIHQSGEVEVGYSTFTVLHPIQGAQTAGSALSYAEKMFMRQAFKVVTGEEDADASDPSSLNAAPDLPALQPPTATKAQAAPATATKALPPPETAGPDHVIRLTDAQQPLVEVKRWSANTIETVREVFVQFVDVCETILELKSFWADNTGAIEGLKAADEASYKRVYDAFMARRAAIKGATHE